MRIQKTVDPGQPQQAIQEIGRIRAGIKGKNAAGIEFPQSTDYFVATGDYAEMFKEKYGEKPETLEIRFFSDREADSCDERFEIRNKAGQLYAYGDGETFYVYNKKAEKYNIVRKKSEDPEIMEKIQAHLQDGVFGKAKDAIKWSQVLYLRFFIADFPVLGYWQFFTKGSNTSIPAIREAFDSFKESTGSVQGVTFLLTIQKVKSNKPNSTVQYPIVKMVPKVSVDEAFLMIERYQNTQRDSSNKLLNMPVVPRLMEPTEGNQEPENMAVDETIAEEVTSTLQESQEPVAPQI